MAAAYVAKGGYNSAALRLGDGTTGVKMAAGRRIEGTRHIPLQDDPLTTFFDVGIGHGDGGQ